MYRQQALLYTFLNSNPRLPESELSMIIRLYPSLPPRPAPALLLQARPPHRRGSTCALSKVTLGHLWFAGEALSEKYFGVCLVRVFGHYFFFFPVMRCALIIDTGRVLAVHIMRMKTRARVAQCLKGQGYSPQPHIAEIY